MENYKTRACLRFDEDIRSSNGLKGRNYERERIREREDIHAHNTTQ